MSKIFFYNADVSLTMKNKRYLKSAIQNLFEIEKRRLNRLNYIFCSDNFLLEINKSYLNHNTLTDVISFHLSDKTQPLFGEIYISIDRIKENAKKYKAIYQQELLRVIIHGALHLCGYKDKSDNEKIKMRNRENFYLKKLVSREA